MMRDMNADFVGGLIAGLLCCLVGALVTCAVLLYRTRPNGGNNPPEEGNPFVETPPPLAPDRVPDIIPDWVFDEQNI